MAKYRKKPVVIDAVSVEELLHNSSNKWMDLPLWIREEYEKGNIVFGAREILISTLEGKMTADPTDMVICGVRGEIYPCKPDIFEATYDKVEE